MDNLTNLPEFYKESVDTESHGLCMIKVCNVTDDGMIACRNVSKSCPNVCHVRCADLTKDTVRFLSIWYCRDCLNEDTKLSEEYEEELKGAVALSTLLEMILNKQIKPSELPSLLQANNVNNETASKLADALSEALDELEARDNDLDEANKKIESLEKLVESYKDKATTEIPVPEEPQPSQPVQPAQFVDAFQSKVDEVLSRARHRRESIDQSRRNVPHSVAFNLPCPTRNQRHSTPFPHSNETTLDPAGFEDQQTQYTSAIAEAAHAYPDYVSQELQANSLGTEQLALLRSHIADPQVFTGDVSNWATFRTLFVGSSRRGHYRAVEDMERLRKLIGGDAYRMYGPEIVDPFAHPTSVLKKLDNFYGVKGNAVRHHLDSLWHLERVDKTSNRELLLNLFASLKQYALLCRQYDQTAELTAESSLLLIESRMHPDHAVAWRNYATTNHMPLSVDTIIAFLEDQLRLIQQKQTQPSTSHVLVAHSTGGQSGTADTSQSKAKKQSQGNSRRPQKCFNCREEHPFFKCPQLLKASCDARKELVRSLKICECCLSAKRHSTNSCTKELRCPVSGCEMKRRHPLLHGHPDNLLPDYGFAGIHNVMAVKHNRVSICYKIIPGHAVAQNGELIPISVLFDTGSSVSLSDMSLLSRAGWPSREYELAMKWTSNVIRTEENARLHDVKFIPFNRKNPITFKGVTAIENLELPAQSQEGEELKRMFPYLRKVPIPSYSTTSPQILLGLPHARFMASIQCIKDPQEKGPIAELSELGWTISGVCSNLCIEALQDPELIGYSLIHSKEPQDEENVDTLIELLKQHFSMDSLGIRGPQATCLSAEDKKALVMIDKTLKFVPEKGRYEVGLLWRDEKCSLPNNYQLALNRLKAAESRLKKLGLEEAIIDQFNKEKATGQLVKVTHEELSRVHRVNFVPGFVTFNYNKVPPKARWVNDTAALCQGVSLNSVLLKGPDNLVPLPQATVALREGEIAILADVRKMFNQILMKKSDQYAQLCLWRDCKSEQPPDIYRQTRMVFGPNCSPSAANSVRIHHAKNSMHKYPEAADVALHQMYMDDVLDSRDNVDEASKVANDLITMFDEIGWELTEFQSNSQELLSRLPADRISNKMIDLGTSKEEPLVTKVLGLFYDPCNDHFMYRLNDVNLLNKCRSPNYHPSRKEMISLIMRVYDPLGLISHFIVHGRLLLQDMCRRGIDWKGRIPEELYSSWLRWLERFNEISQLKISRRYAPVPLGDAKISMHLFVDASQETYACAVYLRFDFGHSIYVRLMTAKVRVAPIKHMTIPRLELNSALIGARLLHTAKQWHRRLKVVDYTAWSDSITVLRWLYAEHIRHKQFVAPRIAEIQELTAVKAWRYVPTDQNVADLATKWCDINFSDSNHRWFTGPDFLYKPQEEWPKLPDDFSRYITDEAVTDTNGPIVEQILMLKSLAEINPWQEGIFLNVSPSIRSDWLKYTRVVALAIRFVNNIKSRIQKITITPQSTTTISPTEMHKAENLIIRKIQMNCFKDDFQRLSKGQNVSSCSQLRSLSPFLCSRTQLIRARTRLSEHFHEDMRYPPILPNLHETSDAIVNYFHNKHNHVGDNAIIGSVRSRVWIISARRAIRRARARCIYCIEKRAKPAVPETAELPAFRLDATKKPFFYCGVDCFGPFEVYVGNSRRKKSVWMVIFTCLITRAVYLEILEDMTTNCMITAIEKLWARRGPIGHFYSDNGRNFVGMSNILANETFQNKLVDKRVSWHFQPPYTPHFGGVWERLIKDIKRALIASVGSFPIPRLALESALAQIESNMNDRPLTDVVISPDDLEPLTPNLLMTGHNSYPFLSCHDITLDDLVSPKYVRCAKAVVQAYMKRWIQEALPELARHKIQKKPAYQIKVNDFVIYIDPSKPPRDWNRGIVTKVYKGKDRKVRVADVRISPNVTLERRSVARLARLDFQMESKEAESNKYVTLNENLNPVTAENYSNVLSVRSETAHSTSKNEKINFFGNKENLSRIAEKLPSFPVQSTINMANSKLRIVETSLGVLSEQEYDSFCNPGQDRIIYATNLPPGAGIAEVWQSLRSFGEIRTIIVQLWDRAVPFYCFVVYARREAASSALKHSHSFCIGLNKAYHRITIEKPTKHINPLKNRGCKGLERKLLQFKNGDVLSRVLVVRNGQPDMFSHPIPISCDLPVVRRQLSHTFMYTAAYCTFDVANITELAQCDLQIGPKLNYRANQQEAYDLATIAQQQVIVSQAEMEVPPAIMDLEVTDSEEVNEPPNVRRRLTSPVRPDGLRHDDLRRVKSVIVRPKKTSSKRIIMRPRSHRGDDFPYSS